MTRALASALAAAVTVFSLVMSACGVTPPQKAPDPIPYDYTMPVPEGDLMGEEWFDDSCVIGHSLMEGFEGFAGVYSNIHYFTATGLSAKGAVSYGKFDLPDGGIGDLATGLKQRQFSKVYVMLGTNEISISGTNYKKNMQAIVDLVRETQGEDVPIYLIALTPTTKKKSDSTAFNKENVLRLNAALQEFCAEEQCYYIDLYDCFADENGYLPAEKSTDGVHLVASQYRVMADYLKSHTVKEN